MSTASKERDEYHFYPIPKCSAFGSSGVLPDPLSLQHEHNNPRHHPEGKRQAYIPSRHQLTEPSDNSVFSLPRALLSSQGKPYNDHQPNGQTLKLFSSNHQTSYHASPHIPPSQIYKYGTGLETLTIQAKEYGRDGMDFCRGYGRERAGKP